MLAKGYADQKNYAKSAEYYKKAKRQGDINLAASYELARVYALGGMYAESFLVLEDLLSQEPDNGLVLSAYAYVATMTGDFKKALEAYGKLKERNQLDKKTIKNYAALLFHSGNYAAALAEINGFPPPITDDSGAMRIWVLSALELCLNDTMNGSDKSQKQEQNSPEEGSFPEHTEDISITSANSVKPTGSTENNKNTGTDISAMDLFSKPTDDEAIKQAESYLEISGNEQDILVLSRLMELYFDKEMYIEGTKTFERIPVDKRTEEQKINVAKIYYTKMDDPQLGKGVLESALEGGYRNQSDFISSIQNTDSAVIEEINNLFKKYIEADSIKKQEE